jgi:Uma2 family endonuclease
MASNPKPYVTPEEYLELEPKAEFKSEYFNGEIFAMGGASPRHVLIVTNLVINLGTQLMGKSCGVFASDLRIKIPVTGLYTYPDVVVLRDKPQYDDKQKDTIINPTVIVEVLSKSTKDYDRGEKFEHYRSIESFTDYVLVAQDKFHVEHFSRQTDGSWLLKETNDIESSVKLGTIACELKLTDIYANYDFVGQEIIEEGNLWASAMQTMKR